VRQQRFHKQRSERGAALVDYVIALSCAVLMCSYVSATTGKVEQRFACAAHVLGGGTDAFAPDGPPETEPNPCAIPPELED